MKYLLPEAAVLFFEISRLQLAFGLVSEHIFLCRVEALSSMCVPNDPTGGYISAAWLCCPSEEREDDWPEDDRPDTGEKESAEGTPASGAQKPHGEEDLFFIMPASLPGWKFNAFDRDFFPSVPHGHLIKDKRRKLDAYLGYVYKGSRQDSRLARRQIISLWNDDKFRDFAHNTIEWYMAEFRNFRWRVPVPLLLPRKR